jgi:poly [ADP-ribose] polymerase
MRSEYLMFVSQNNNNKWYRMAERDDGTFLAQWGRVGAAGQDKVYPGSMWDSQLRSKLAKGYTRVAGHGDAVISGAFDVSVKDDVVRELISFLMKSAKQSVKLNYNVDAGSVTQAQISVAQDIIGQLQSSIGEPAAKVNVLLEQLYRTVPRKMSDTRKYFLRPVYADSYLRELLQSEQALLDSLGAQAQGGALHGEQLTLDSLGLDIQVASDTERKEIAKKTDFKVSNQKIFRVVNKLTALRFKNTDSPRLLYHGAKNFSWMGILSEGLRIKPAGIPTTGSMYGNGCYFASKAKKSIGYTSLKGSYWASGNESRAFLAVFEVALGRVWDVQPDGNYQTWMSSLNDQKVKAKGYDSVYAKAGADLRNDEYIVYDVSRCNIKYLIELNS